MLKNLCQLEQVIANKVCRFVCDNDTDINVIKEALFQFQKFIGSVEDIAKAQKEAEAAKVTPIAPDAIDLPPTPLNEEPVQVALSDNQHA